MAMWMSPMASRSRVASASASAGHFGSAGTSTTARRSEDTSMGHRNEWSPDAAIGAPVLKVDVLAAAAEEPQQHQEQIDEIEIEPQRTEDRLAAHHRAVIVGDVHLLDLLRVNDDGTVMGRK